MPPKKTFHHPPGVYRHVVEYVEKWEMDPSTVGRRPSAESVAEHLRSSYSEHMRLKFPVLLASVSNALGAVLAERGFHHDAEEGKTSDAVPSGMSGGMSSGDREDVHNIMNRSLRGKMKLGSQSTPLTPSPLPPKTDASRKQKRASSSSRSGKRGRDGEFVPREKEAEEEFPPFSRLAARVESKVSFSDLGGMEDALQIVKELMEYPLKHPEVYRHLGVEPAKGILLHGPPGCGKTLLAHAIAGELGVPFFPISAPEVVSGMSGQSEEKLRSLFSEARRVSPSIIFIDEIDAITPKRSTAQREMEKRIVAQLLSCLDDLSGADEWVMVIGATNRPHSLDPALRRAGRFDREISLGIPDVHARAKILHVLCKKLRLEGKFDFYSLAKLTPGYVGADLCALTKEAGAACVNRIFFELKKTKQDVRPGLRSEDAVLVADRQKDREYEESNTMYVKEDVQEAVDEMEVEKLGISDEFRSGFIMKEDPYSPEELETCGVSITMEDFQEAITKVQPSAKREGFATIPDVSWDDIGALEEVREELTMAIVEPIRSPETFAKLGLDSPSGVLLYGPPGCGKTLVAKAVANTSGANFISIKGPELLNKYVGESEKAVRQVFARGRASSPCIIFFDEMDSLCPKRGSDTGGGSTERVVNQLLTELDGLEARQSVFVIAATNRPDIIDPAMLRPGRLDKILYVPLPTPENRVSILETISRKIPLDGEIDLREIGMRSECEGFSGADLVALLREASVAALKEYLKMDVKQEDPKVLKRHIEFALTKILPSVSRKDERIYMAMKRNLRRARAHVDPTKEEGGDS
eukprot:TRINITY_DN62966_c0_g1_i1.p1 TRINITY_DN62966_c0_g1~~TRINITY_DN62966_c0_g1_i1.p1  ORF type:complete len:811 (+),score=235.49 TRINITY_DN62966_c0_g1_i1:154-2586(+)